MATTAIWDVRGWLGQVVHYVENPDKTVPEKIVLVYAWNELGEGGYLVPTKADPSAKKLKEIKKAVFK